MSKLAGLVKARKKPSKITPRMIAYAKKAASPNPFESYAAFMEITKALMLPLRDAILHGDIVSTIYEQVDAPPGQVFTYPKSCFNPENDGNFDAFVMPQFGTVPDRQVVGDYVMVPTFKEANGISASVSYVEHANWDVMQAMAAQLVNGHVRTKNRLGFETLLAAAAARNFTVTDALAGAGLFTKRLLNLANVKMQRLGGGNSASLNRRRLTDVYYSLEGQVDLRNWDITQIDDFTRREIFIASDDDEKLTEIFGIRLHPMHEFGVGQAYQDYITRATGHGGLGKALPSGDEEFALGVDQSGNVSFLNPVKKGVEIYPDSTMRRDGKFGWWSEAEYGLAVLDNRNVELLSF